MAPATVLAERFKSSPSHTGLSLEAVGADGIGFTVTETVPAGPVHPATVAVTEYVPLIDVFELEMEGFCNEEAYAFGPVHEYVAPVIVLAVKLIELPAHTGELLPAVGAAGIAFTVSVVFPALLVHPFTVTVTE